MKKADREAEASAVRICGEDGVGARCGDKEEKGEVLRGVCD